MGYELTQDTVFYIVVAFIIIMIGIGIATGFRPWQLVQKVDTLFEPGRLSVQPETDLAKKTELGCLGAVYILTLNGPQFQYKSKAGEKDLSFIVVLDYKLLFVGHNAKQHAEEIITCTLPSDSDLFQCPQTHLWEFELQGVGGISGRQTFHFTAWKAKPALIAAVKENGATLSSVLDGYPDSYISSFDLTLNTGEECKKTECGRHDEHDCKTEGDECYWSAPWFTASKCKLCPQEGFTDCRNYDVDQCEQCPIPKTRCKVGWEPALSLRGCQPG